MLYTVFFAQIKFSVDSLYPVHCPRTSILDFLKIGQVLLSPCSLHIYISYNMKKFNHDTLSYSQNLDISNLYI